MELQRFDRAGSICDMAWTQDDDISNSMFINIHSKNVIQRMGFISLQMLQFLTPYYRDDAERTLTNTRCMSIDKELAM